MPNVPVLNTLAVQVLGLAQQLGIQNIVIVGQDPKTGEVALYGTDAAKAAVRAKVEEVFGINDPNVGETSWNDV